MVTIWYTVNSSGRRQRKSVAYEDIARAKRLGLNPKSLIKNIPSKSEPWKAPVKEWLIEIEEERLRKSEQKKKRKAAAMKKATDQSE